MYDNRSIIEGWCKMVRVVNRVNAAWLRHSTLNQTESVKNLSPGHNGSPSPSEIFTYTVKSDQRGEEGREAAGM